MNAERSGCAGPKSLAVMAGRCCPIDGRQRAGCGFRNCRVVMMRLARRQGPLRPGAKRAWRWVRPNRGEVVMSVMRSPAADDQGGVASTSVATRQLRSLGQKMLGDCE